MLRKYAVIDIGTLKVKFLIAEISSSNELEELHFSNTLTCFGCGLDENEGNVKEENLEKTVEELLKCKEKILEFDVVETRVVSTHALRRARNKEMVTKRIYEKTGFRVENISQEEEANLFFRGVIQDFTSDQRYAVVDMGGGSVQILIGNKDGLEKTHLMQTGSAYLHENFTNDFDSEESFTTEEDLERMRKYILEQLLPLKGIGDIPIIYGSSNIIDLMKTIGLPLDENPDSHTHPYRTYARYLEEFIQKVLPLNYREREEKYPFQWGYMWGVDKAFLNIITMAEHFPSSYIIPSNSNLSRGIIYELAGHSS